MLGLFSQHSDGNDIFQQHRFFTFDSTRSRAEQLLFARHYSSECGISATTVITWIGNRYDGVKLTNCCEVTS